MSGVICFAVICLAVERKLASTIIIANTLHGNGNQIDVLLFVVCFVYCFAALLFYCCAVVLFSSFVVCCFGVLCQQEASRQISESRSLCSYSDGLHIGCTTVN